MPIDDDIAHDSFQLFNWDLHLKASVNLHKELVETCYEYF